MPTTAKQFLSEKNHEATMHTLLQRRKGLELRYKHDIQRLEHVKHIGQKLRALIRFTKTVEQMIPLYSHPQRVKGLEAVLADAKEKLVKLTEAYKIIRFREYRKKMQREGKLPPIPQIPTVFGGKVSASEAVAAAARAQGLKVEQVSAFDVEFTTHEKEEVGK